jgi:tetratricopeptide (TPR) repeat protein
MIEQGESGWRWIRARWTIVVALVVGTLVVYGQLHGHPFLPFDDGDYVRDNPHVRGGLTWDGVAWAFTTMHAANWHPLTWLSHMLDVELFGVAPGPQHLVNAALHAANVAVLFLALARMTGARGRSAAVAALFAAHPLHVESVAWIAERKDLLSTLSGFLALWAYARYAERPAPRRYALVALFFALSLLSKPMWVTLPFLLLLLDFWPLQRVERSPAEDPELPVRPRAPLGRLVVEKLPLLALSLASSIVTVVAQRSGHAMTSERFGLGPRLANAVLSYARYLEETAWPSSLAIYYPHRWESTPALHVAMAATVLVGITALVVRAAKQRPYVPLGWCWFLGTLVPVIGIVQVGGQAMADRYMYLPIVGLLIAAVWSARSAAVALGRLAALPVVAAVAIAVLSALTWRQLGYWSTNEALFRHALSVTDDNGMVHGMLATTLGRAGRHAEALSHAREAVRLQPSNPANWAGLAAALRANGAALSESKDALDEAVRVDPDYLPAWNTLVEIDVALGDLAGAARASDRATQLAPEDARAWYRKGLVYLAADQPVEAVPFLREAIRLQPGLVEARETLRRVESGDARR